MIFRRAYSPLRIGSRPKARISPRTILLSLTALIIFAYYLLPGSAPKTKDAEVPVGPLTKKYVQQGHGVGGRWYIPPSWQDETTSSLESNATVLEAAELALGLVLQRSKFLDNSRIPLIAHQTWRTFDTVKWPPVIRRSVEDWIDVAVGDDAAQMAWILWDDAGIDALMNKYEPELYDDFLSLPYPVEKADMFRVVVVKWFGGVYSDVDAKPLKHPKEWVYNDDLTPWTDTYTKAEHAMHAPSASAYAVPQEAPMVYQNLFPRDGSTSGQTVNAIFGIEADNPPDPDSSYWRMGYTWPVQLTNWALAMAPQHPIATQFLSTLKHNITTERSHLHGIDPLDLTGPPALTAAVRHVAISDDDTLNWDALSALHGKGNSDPDGGRGKVVAGDALILPITGFSPGRGWFQNMGSKPVTHPNARLRHEAAGSWKNMDVKVHYGKLCRQVFGMCREWKKISE